MLGELRLVVPLKRRICFSLLVHHDDLVGIAVHRFDDTVLGCGLGRIFGKRSRRAQRECAECNECCCADFYLRLHIGYWLLNLAQHGRYRIYFSRRRAMWPLPWLSEVCTNCDVRGRRVVVSR